MALSFLAGRTPAVFHAADRPSRTVQAVIPPDRDIYGNEVHRALGAYRVDLRGDLYEEHSPDTAVLKLGSPSS
jgi:hypothetical protein